MKCPVDQTELVTQELETQLAAHECVQCGGHWITAAQYWGWLHQHDPTLPEKPAEESILPQPHEPEQAKICPDCGHILIAFKVGHALGFSIDKCGACGGIWFDGSEWETLKSRSLHDEVHKIFSDVWQNQIARNEHAEARERLWRERFGDEIFVELQRIKAWLEVQPNKKELTAFLTH